MKKYNTIIIILVLAWAVSTHCLYSQVAADTGANESLISVITGKKWQQLPSLFLDNSHKTLKKYFATVQSIKITTSQPDHVTYKAKFSQQAEMGVIAFEKKSGKYLNLEIKNQIKPLYFIEAFKKYRAANVQLTVGDAQLHFTNGHFYESVPSGSLLVFKGEWNISINPNDEEEKRTLKRQYKKDHFEDSGETGVFILDSTDFLGRLPLDGEITVLDEDAYSCFNLYRDLYGINVDAFDEYWYLPFSQGTNFIIFEKDKKSFYYYSYNQNLVPDTQLTESDTNKMLLSYNAHKGLKLSFGKPNKVTQVKLNIYFNPRDNFISGTTAVTYKNPANVKELHLDKGLEVVRNLTPGSEDLNIFRKQEKYYFMGESPNTLSLYYKGRIQPTEENLELFKPPQDTVLDGPESETDVFYFLDRAQNFYPNPGDEFFETHVTVNLPAGLNCLASGSLEGTTRGTGDTSAFKFSSSGSKGISLVTGNFKLTQKLDTLSQVPLQFYSRESFRYPGNLDLAEVKEAFDFFVRSFGALDLSAVNLLLKRGRVEGGVSNNGFIVVHLPPDRTLAANVNIRALDASSIEKKIISPILIRDRTEDHIIHELAHQWWGGVISWKSYQDVWLTEGLAHFSVLYYLKSKLSRREFNRIIKRLKRWVHRYTDSGPIIYGTRINLLEEKYEPYQSVIYNKGALVFLMLVDLIGEKEFNRRLQSVVKKFKYQSISSNQFIRQFSGKNPLIRDFFRKWIFSRAIPRVELALVEDDKEMDKKEFKKVVIRITQLNTDFIFPLKLRVATRKGVSIDSVIVKAKEQKFVIKKNATIRTIDVADSTYLVKEKKQPPPQFQQKRQP